MVKLPWWRTLRWLTTYYASSIVLSNSHVFALTLHNDIIWKVLWPPFCKRENRTGEMWLHLRPQAPEWDSEIGCVWLFLHSSYLIWFFPCQIEMVHSFVHSGNFWAPTWYLRSCCIQVLDWVLGIEQWEKQSPYSPIQLGRKTNTNKTHFIVSISISC